MWDEIINIAISNGIFAALFVALFIYQLKDSSTREKKYQKTIEALSTKLDVVKDIKEDIVEIKNVIIYEKDKQNERKIKKINI